MLGLVEIVRSESYGMVHRLFQDTDPSLKVKRTWSPHSDYLSCSRDHGASSHLNVAALKRPAAKDSLPFRVGRRRNRIPLLSSSGILCLQHLPPSRSFPVAWLLLSLLTPAAALGQGNLPTQTLPVRAQVCGPVAGEPQLLPPASTCVALEVPETPEQYAIGLMGRSHLPPERGMWFRFDQQDASMWMRNMLIPLDLVFLEQHHPNGQSGDPAGWLLPTARIVKVAHGVPPCPALPCPSYRSGQPVDHVVELAAGEARRRNWEEGTVLDFNWLEESGGENDRSQ